MYRAEEERFLYVLFIYIAEKINSILKLLKNYKNVKEMPNYDYIHVF